MTRVPLSPACGSAICSSRAMLARRKRVIARDHHRADAGRAAGLDSLAHFLARRIDHASHPDKDHVALQAFLIDRGRQTIQRAKARAQHAHPLLGQAIVGSLDPLLPCVVQGFDRAVHPYMRAHLQQTVHRAFGKRDMGSTVDGQPGPQPFPRRFLSSCPHRRCERWSCVCAPR